MTMIYNLRSFAFVFLVSITLIASCGTLPVQTLVAMGIEAQEKCVNGGGKIVTDVKGGRVYCKQETPEADDTAPESQEAEEEESEPAAPVWVRQLRYEHADFPGSIQSGNLDFELKNVGGVPIKHGSIFLHFEGVTIDGDKQNIHAMIYGEGSQKIVRFVRHHWDKSNGDKLDAPLQNHSLPPDPDLSIHIAIRWDAQQVWATLTHGPHVREYQLKWVAPMHRMNFLRIGEGVYPGRNGKPIGRDVMVKGEVTI